MANAITLSRLLLVLFVVWFARQPTSPWHFANFFLVALIFVTDAMDGYVARKRRETSLFGALFDIAGDRIAEITLWILVADLGLVPLWVPILFVVRGVIVDTIRASQARSFSMAPFAMVKSRLGQWLVAGRFMRGFYAVAKACAFCGLVTIEPFRSVTPGVWDEIGSVWAGLTYAFVYVSVAVCVLRGLPVIAEFVAANPGRGHD